MNTSIVVLVYSLAVILGIFLDWRFPRVKWYWHVGALLIAIGLGIMPPVQNWTGPAYDMAMGAVLLFLLVWALVEPLFRMMHVHRHV